MSIRFVKPETRRYAVDEGLHKYMTGIYRYMALGLALTGGVAFSLRILPLQLQYALYNSSWLAMLGTFGLVFYFNTALNRISASTAQGLFWLYSGLMGLSLGGIFRFYHTLTLAQAFFAAAGTFAVTSLYAHVTRKDLSSIGSFCVMGAWGVAIAMVINFFIGSAAFGFACSVIGVMVSVGLAAYNTQTLRELYYGMPHHAEVREKVAVLGALSLYMNVINLFLFILRLMDREK